MAHQDPERPERRRQQRGEERRQSLVEACVRIIEADGLEGVTHRRVAVAAGVPLAATTYYFSSKEDLMQAAMEHVIATESERLQVIADAVTRSGDMSLEQGVEALIQWQLALLRERPLAQFAEFELFLRVARTAPRPGDLPSWTESFRAVARQSLELLGSPDPEQDSYALVALIHGLVLHALTTADPTYPETVLAPVLRDWFRMKVGSGGAGG